MRFFLVHELSCSNGAGRLRARACRPMTQVQAEILADTLDAIDGVEGVRVNPRVPSVLVLYRHAQARQDVLRSLAAQDAGALNDGSVLATLTQELENSLERHASGSRLPAHDEDEMGAHGFGPLMRFLFVRPFLPFKLRVASSVMGALPFLRKGLASLLQGKLNVDVLDAAAIGVSLLRRDFRTVTVLTLLLGLGEALEYWTRRRSMDSLTESLALNVDTVWVLADGVETSVPLSDVREGDLVVVRDGGSIPVDGIVEDGEAVVNQASMTGEPLGVARSKGAAVYSGTVVEQGHLVIRATHVGDGTRLKQVVRFIEESEALKAGIQGKFERMADMAVPFTFALAGLVWLITRNPMQAASVLLVDYSCALRLATPLAVLAAMREGARHGVVIKGGRFLEALSEADTVVFDKTGTLTNASPHVVEVIPAAGHDRDEVLRLAACLEEHFPHPVARAVVRCAQEEGLQHEEEHAQVEYVVAHGIASTLYGKAVRVGSRHYIECDEGIDLSPLEAEIDAQARMGRSLLYLAIDGKLAGIWPSRTPCVPNARRSSSSSKSWASAASSCSPATTSVPPVPWPASWASRNTVRRSCPPTRPTSSPTSPPRAARSSWWATASTTRLPCPPPMWAWPCATAPTWPAKWPMCCSPGRTSAGSSRPGCWAGPPCGASTSTLRPPCCSTACSWPGACS